jgi:hypothetical protein
MNLTSTAARLTASLAATFALAACGGTVDFSVEKDMVIDTQVDGGTVLQPFDLAAEASSAWKHRKNVDSVHVTVAEARVVEVLLPANTATTVSGEVWLLPEGASVPGAGAVKVGSYAGEEVVAGNVISLQLSPDLDAFIHGALKGSGRFGLYATGAGASGQVVSCKLHLVLAGTLKWKAG